MDVERSIYTYKMMIINKVLHHRRLFYLYVLHTLDHIYAY